MATLKNQMDSLLSPEDMMLQGLEEGTVEQAAEDLKSVGKGALFSPITGAADVVETGKMLPELDERAKPFAPVYSSVEGAFEELAKLGFTRENAVKAIKDITGVELKSDSAEMAGELIGLPAVAATKAASAVAKAATKYGSEAPKAVSRISAEAKKIFTDTGGFDDMATATAGSSAAQTSKMLSKKDLPDTSVTKIIIGQSGKDYEQKADSYRRAKQAWIPGKNRVNDQDAQELWNRTGAQEDVIDGDIVYEVPTVNAKLKTQDSDLFDYDKGTVSFTGGKDRDTPVMLSEILDFDELYEQAPYLRDVEVRRISGFARLLGTRAAYNPTENVIYIASGSSKNLTSNLLHEVEHAVQAADGKTYAGGNFRRIMNQDPEYKKLGGSEKQNKLNKDAENLINKYSGSSDSDEYFNRRGEVRGMLEILAKTPNPSKFVQAVTKLPEIEGANRGGGTFKYLSDISNYMEKNFPTINLQYSSLIDDAMTFIRNTDQKTIDALIKDYKKAGLSDLQKFEKIKEKAILKYMRDPGEVTARNVQFRYLTSQQDPSITNVVPRATEDRYISSKEIPFDNKPPTKTAEQLAEEGRRMDVPLTEEGYYTSTAAERGDAAESLAEQTDNMISVFPKPERMFPEGERPKGGDYLNPQTGEVLSGRNVSSANIKINPDGRPSFRVSDDNIDEVGSVGKGKSSIKVNLFKKKAGWKWDSAPDEYKDIGTLVSVEHKGKHFYTLETDFSKGVTLKKYPDSKTEPRLRPTVVGNIEIGEEVGSISVRGKKHPVYGKITTFNRGGAVPMNTMSKQMELFEPVERGFEEGGLMEEGGMVDEVSGNDVPPGSLRTEVRDDIPAQLSEGEFVFPADVVRYIGLEKLMMMRQEAKQGLAQMKAMGQMGNSEEAIIEDDLPFDMYDLDIEEEDEYNNMAVGGMPQQSQPMKDPRIQSGYVTYQGQRAHIGDLSTIPESMKDEVEIEYT